MVAETSSIPTTITPSSGTLSVSSSPAGANVYLDGTLVGTTPVTIPAVTAGTHTVFLTMQDYEDITQTIEITGGSYREFTASLKKKTPIVLPPIIAPFAGIATGIILGALAAALNDFIKGAFGETGVKMIEAWEEKKKKLHAIRRKEIFAGLSFIEIVVAALSAVLMGGAVFIIYPGLFIVYPDIFIVFQDIIYHNLLAIPLFIVIAGSAIILHDLTRRWVARRHGNYGEYQIWLVGTIILYLTAWKFGYACGKPSRPVFQMTWGKDSRELVVECLAGPAVSVVSACFFATLISYGEIAKTIGILGVSTNIQLALYNLMPFEPMDGPIVRKWNKWIYWMIFLTLVVIYITFAYLFPLS